MAIRVAPKVKRNAVLFLVLAGGVMWFPVARLLLGTPPGFLRNLGFFSEPRGTLLAWCLGVLIAAGYSTYAVRRIPLVREYWRAVSALKFLCLLVAVAAAVVEEAVFRRVLMDGLMRAGWPDAWQVLASGLVFGIAHASWAVVTGRLGAGVGAMVATGALGTALAFVYVIGNRSLAPVIVAHFLVTATIQPGILFAAFSGEMRRAA
jgi:hypothetical protein